jgi:hypothetical protein
MPLSRGAAVTDTSPLQIRLLLPLTPMAPWLYPNASVMTARSLRPLLSSRLLQTQETLLISCTICHFLHANTLAEDANIVQMYVLERCFASSITRFTTTNHPNLGHIAPIRRGGLKARL